MARAKSDSIIRMRDNIPSQPTPVIIVNPKKKRTKEDNFAAKYGKEGYRTPLQLLRLKARERTIEKGMATAKRYEALKPKIALAEERRTVREREQLDRAQIKFERQQAAKSPRGVIKAGLTAALGLQGRRRGSVGDQLKILRFKNKLEKAKLQNQIQALRLAKRGLLLKPAMQPMPKPVQPIYPAYATVEVARDIDSAFNADMGHGDNLFGNESWFGSEGYYDENFFGDEMNEDPLHQLGLYPERGGNPLLW